MLDVVGQGARVQEVDRGLRLLLRSFEQYPALSVPVQLETVSESITTPAGEVVCVAQPGGYHIMVKLLPPAQQLSPLDALYYLEPEILNIAIRQSEGHLWIHGACLLKEGRLTLLVASTGVGKTTLSLGLLGRGFRLLTDDVFLLNLRNEQVIPVPRCPRIRPPAAELLAAAGFDLPHAARLMGNYVLLGPEQLVSGPQSAPVGRVFLLSREPDSNHVGKVRTLSGGDGVLRLLAYSNLVAIDPH